MISKFVASGKITEKGNIKTYGKGTIGIPFEVAFTDIYSNASGRHLAEHKVKLFAWREMAADINGLSVGDEVILELKMSTRDYNGKTYVDIKTEGIVMVNGVLFTITEQGAEARENIKKEEEIPF